MCSFVFRMQAVQLPERYAYKMKQLNITEHEAGQRLDRLLAKVFSQAGKGFLYKMLRKKNIVLNGKRAEGNETLKDGDIITVYFSDETYEKLSAVQRQSASMSAEHKILYRNGEGEEGTQKRAIEKRGRKLFPKVVYEDKHVLILHKPAGMLSQKAEESDDSLVDFVQEYLLETGSITAERLQTFRPGICNRLDRNTEGLVIAGKTILGLQTMSELLRDRTLDKYYLCVVKGTVERSMRLKGSLTKDEMKNQVTISKGPEGEAIETEYRPIAVTKTGTLLEVKLITGKSHQIRAHLASVGHPIAGDMKYGDAEYNRMMKERFGVRHQMLIAYRMVFPELAKEFAGLSGREVKTGLPAVFGHFCKTYDIKV